MRVFASVVVFSAVIAAGSAYAQAPAPRPTTHAGYEQEVQRIKRFLGSVFELARSNLMWFHLC
jgi:hypothetical protein